MLTYKFGYNYIIKVLSNRGQGSGILVSKIPKETNASYTLQDPSEVRKIQALIIIFYLLK